MVTMKECIGTVTEEEKNEMMALYERKMGLEELPSSLESIVISAETKKIVQEKIIIESQKIKIEVQEWWNKMYKKYRWRKEEGRDWHINFETGEVFFE